MSLEERYQKLVTRLRESAKAFDDAKDDDDAEDDEAFIADKALKARHSAGIVSLRAVIQFLHGDKDVLDGCLTRPLGAIESAAYDTGQGAKPLLLQHSPPRTGKPTLTSREQVQGGLAAVVEILKRGGMGTQAAVNWIIKQAREKRVFREDGAEISVGQLNSWLKEIRRDKKIRRGAPQGAIEAYDLVLRAYRTRLEKLPPANRREGAEVLALAAIRSFAATSPQSAPRQNNQVASRKRAARILK